ncbi:unnamed protein product, partial [Amoebophrya sp. A25]|eukprot:GSA25T00016852001.1
MLIEKRKAFVEPFLPFILYEILCYPDPDTHRHVAALQHIASHFFNNSVRAGNIISAYAGKLTVLVLHKQRQQALDTH